MQAKPIKSNSTSLLVSMHTKKKKKREKKKTGNCQLFSPIYYTYIKLLLCPPGHIK